MPPLYNIIKKSNLAAIAALSVLVIAGCGKKDPQYVEVQEVKESPVVEQNTALADMHGHDHSASGTLFHYEKPVNWSEKVPSSMVLMAFQAGTPPEVPADVQISAFPGDVGGRLANINRWRRQVGLGSIDQEAMDGIVTELEISGLPAWQVHFTGPASTSHAGEPFSMVVSAVFHDEQTWFFKLVGSESAVAGELSSYNAFIASVKF